MSVTIFELRERSEVSFFSFCWRHCAVYTQWLPQLIIIYLFADHCNFPVYTDWWGYRVSIIDDKFILLNYNVKKWFNEGRWKIMWTLINLFVVCTVENVTWKKNSKFTIFFFKELSAHLKMPSWLNSFWNTEFSKTACSLGAKDLYLAARNTSYSKIWRNGLYFTTMFVMMFCER